jgi:hypothetical protein
MDLDFKSLGNTLSIGCLFCMCIMLINHLCIAKRLLTLKTSIKRINDYKFIGGLTFFITGVLCEEITESIASDKGGVFYQIFNSVADSKSELRLRCLFQFNKYNRLDPRPVYDDLVGLTKLHGSTLTKIKNMNNMKTEFMNVDIDESAIGQLSKRVDAVYYAAKNIVYKESMYNSELLPLEARLRFLRAVMVILLFAIAAKSALVLLWLIPCRFADRHLLKRLKSDLLEKLSVRAKHASRKTFVISTIFDLFLLILLAEAHRSVANEYFSRVFGYFVSLSI